MFLGREKGFIQLGIIGILVLVAGLFAATKLASNPDLTFFNTSSDAAGIEKAKCNGCDGRMLRRWDNKRQVCTQTSSLACKPTPTPKPTPKLYSDPPKPTPPTGCKYVSVQCFKAPCPAVLVCPSPSPTPKDLTCGGINGGNKTCPKGYECIYSNPNATTGTTTAPYPDAQGVCKPVATKCVIGGCNNEVCAEESAGGGPVSACVYRKEYSCYKASYAKCERQKDGQCGWTQNAELKSCLYQG